MLRRRSTRLAAVSLSLAVVLLLVGHGVIASAIVVAPARYGATDPVEALTPAERAELGAHAELAVEVGPPVATLSAWLVEPRGKPRGTVVLLHGIGADKRLMLPAARPIVDAGYRAVIPDLRGHGRSGGEYLTYGVVESRDISQLLDAVAARGTPLGPVGVYGYSYGGAVAMQLAARDARVRAAVIVSTFATLRGVVADYEARLLPGVSSLLPDAYVQSAVDDAGEMAAFDPDQASPRAAAARMTGPLLLIHGTTDERIPFHNAVALARAAGPRATLVPVPGASHGSILGAANGSLRPTVLAFLARALTPAPARSP